MIRTYLIPLLAIAGMVFAVVTVVKGSKPPPATPPVVEPPRAPFEAFVAGSGLIEAASQNIAIGTPVGNVVTKVNVVVGDEVKKGDVLFELDSRELQSQLDVKQTLVGVAKATLDRLKAGTRPELLPGQRAKVAEAEAELADAKSQLAKMTNVTVPGAVSADDLDRRQYAVATAEARLSEAKAQLALLEAGTWQPEIDEAAAQVASAQADVESVKVELERRVIKAPIDCRVLQVNVRPGEFAQAGVLATPLMLVGSVHPLHVRVDVDENDSWRVKAGAKAFAYARGNKDINTPLQFVRFEPYVVPKKSLTGDSAERVDTRVLQVIYSFDPKDLPLYVGQQVDVFIQADPIRREGQPPEEHGTKG
ncbi:MAG: biotin/lipoyl-binding protein [Tepidisphaera sp.]|nr:biotin/lipoyl-binding protein [Tepidisphaera sp.]